MVQSECGSVHTYLHCPNHFLCIGLNYSDHAAETGAAIPEHPILFFKANSAIVGANDDVVMPRGSTNTDWEVELGVVIGTTAKYVSKENARQILKRDWLLFIVASNKCQASKCIAPKTFIIEEHLKETENRVNLSLLKITVTQSH